MRRLKGSAWTAWGWRQFRRPPAALLMLTVRKSRRCAVIDSAMGAPLTVYPGEVPARLPGQAFWDKQGFQFEAFRPQVMDVDKPLPHIRLDAALEFLIGDKLR
ncbi:putative ATP-binding protein [Escherichia coli]|uniref:Putative ATP-binding protein n=1 Tax=Escherichia coli TaxID=562 RepID=A0A485JJ46_ECOLX|nr:putative ATP-binding protein [Escherichia coli]